MADPTRPGEIPRDCLLDDLVQRRHEHSLALLKHRCGMAPLTDAQRAVHCLAELAYSTALAERATAGRWVVTVGALEAGASHEQVAAAVGLDVEALAARLRSWAAGQLRHGLIDQETYDQVLELLGEQPGTPDPMDQQPSWVRRSFALLLEALGDPALAVDERASLLIVARQDETTVRNLAAVIRRVKQDQQHPGGDS